jgi:cell division protein FtsZ
MLDEKLDDQVWVTVIATGYDDRRGRRRESDRSTRGDELVSALLEPVGEPRVSRIRERPMRPAVELDVPEFIPRR